MAIMPIMTVASGIVRAVLEDFIRALAAFVNGCVDDSTGVTMPNGSGSVKWILQLLLLAPLPAPQLRDLVVELAPYPLGLPPQPLVVTPLVGLGLALELPIVL